MHNHFDKNLNLESLIRKDRPRVIVECGAGTGELTRLLSPLCDEIGSSLHVISDAPVAGLPETIKWKSGLSYNALAEFPDGGIDLCIIDTDHNYWTLMKEFAALYNKISEGGYIALHDVSTFYHDTGMALSYSTGEPYPKDEIESFAPHGSLGDAMIEFLHLKKWHFRLVAFTSESHGAALIQKRTQSHYSIMVPGVKPAYAAPKI